MSRCPLYLSNHHQHISNHAASFKRKNQNEIHSVAKHVSFQLIRSPISRHFATDDEGELGHVQYERLVSDALENLTDYFESFDELENCPEDYDVQYADGVLTVSLGSQHGTYVINKQTPNKQIWLSSPASGPKRYDFQEGRWVYSHDGQALHDLLSEEISAIFQQTLDFTELEKESR
ncbi:putative frataxin, mitochondrial [Apostichopus japonicus]|uniref:ferroxidase n=1 Tax=Stichopus japonicus TaxID=307972 RepID=A0A2G8K6R6_STIJA|nr:putative frataxin, mitochondrial [Apostichopus japonicus]